MQAPADADADADAAPAAWCTAAPPQRACPLAPTHPPALPCPHPHPPSLTYNVVGHIKTVLILSGGVLFFGDAMPPKKIGGIVVAMAGIVW